MFVGARKKSVPVNALQEIINARLRELYDMKDFVKHDTSNIVANTYGVVCPNCKVKDNIYAETVQTRSGDESADRICVCLNCSYRWKIHGG